MRPLLTRSIVGSAFLLTMYIADASATAFTEFSRPLTLIEQQRTVYVAIAANDSERERGLMFRQDLGENQGMLFVYPDQAHRGVWMKNTLIALDVIFLSGDERIVAMLKDLPPCIKDPCRIYDSKLPARYILEVRAGFIDKHALKLGQLVTLPGKPQQDR